MDLEFVRRLRRCCAGSTGQLKWQEVEGSAARSVGVLPAHEDSAQLDVRLSSGLSEAFRSVELLEERARR